MDRLNLFSCERLAKVNPAYELMDWTPVTSEQILGGIVYDCQGTDSEFVPVYHPTKSWN